MYLLMPLFEAFFMKRGTKKQILIKILALVLALNPLMVLASVSTAVTYLKSQSPDAWTTQALVAAGEINVATDHLKTVEGALATDYAKNILALAAAGKNPATFSDIDYVAKLKTFYKNDQMGDESLINDDAWSILALASVGEVDTIENQAAKNFLLSKQNSDGGWGYAIGVGSDTNDTAAIIMALVEAGVSADDQVIIKALDYLHTAQNNDGGFPYDPVSPWGTGSDSNSDAWVISAIYKVGQNPNNWLKESKSPIDHLNSLQDTDGGFWWVTPGTSEWNNKGGTAQAVIALAGKTYPVGYFRTVSANLRIEGTNNTLCNTTINANNGLDILQNAAVGCNYTYNIQDTAYGPYLNQINNEVAAEQNGWLYLVNNISSEVGAVDYKIKINDDVVWYYGEWGWQPLRLLASKNSLNFGDQLILTAQSFDGQSWSALSGVSIVGLDKEYLTDTSGQLKLIAPSGNYSLFAQKVNYVRSQKNVLQVNLNSNQINASGDITLDNLHNEAVILSVPANITIPQSITNASLNFLSLLQNGDTNTIAILPAIKLNISKNGLITPLQITTVLGAKITTPTAWDGIIKITEINSDESTKLNTFGDKNIITSIALGDGFILNSDQAIRILIPSSNSKKVGYLSGDNFTEITKTCSDDTQTTNNLLSNNEYCKININSDLVVWMKNFSNLIVYSPVNTVVNMSSLSPSPSPDSIGDQNKKQLTDDNANNSAKNTIDLLKTVEPKTKVTINKIEVVKSDLFNNDVKKLINGEIDKKSVDLSSQIVSSSEQIDTADKYLNNLIDHVDNLAKGHISILTDFINYGTESTKKLGEGERAGLLNSFKRIFQKMPTNQDDWLDLVGIGNNMVPSRINLVATQEAQEVLEKIYGRKMNIENIKERNIVNMVAYGLRPDKRDFEKEKKAIIVFQKAYIRNPFSAADWDLVRGIAYSDL